MSRFNERAAALGAAIPLNTGGIEGQTAQETRYK